MLGKVQGNTGNGYFSQAVSEYAKRMKPGEEKKESSAGKMIGEFSHSEWNRILEKADHSIEEYREDLKRRKEEALEQKKEQTENYILGKGTKTQQEYEVIQKLIGNRNAPYSVLADENGMVTYNGTVFQCDYEKNQLCLGDVSNPDNCLTIPLEKGGCLVVNRDNIDGLVQAIGMFSPADVKRIMQAIAEDAKVRQIQLQIEDETSGVPVLEKEGEHESEK